jgi:hypothetical protein
MFGLNPKSEDELTASLIAKHAYALAASSQWKHLQWTNAIKSNL